MQAWTDTCRSRSTGRRSSMRLSAATSEPCRSKPEVRSQRGTVKILVAEDEPLSRRRLQAFLRKWGYTVHIAVDGAEALHALRQSDSPRLAVLDRMMPEV